MITVQLESIRQTDNPPEGYQPIHLENFRYGYNAKGQFCISFDSNNHKYLEIEDDGTLFHGGKTEQHFRISTFEKEKKEEELGEYEYNPPLCSMSFSMTSDSKEELDKVVYADMAILPLKWHYQIAFFPYSDMDFEEGTELKGLSLEELEKNEEFEFKK